MGHSLERIIWNKLGIHRGDTLPLCGAPWHESDRNTLVQIFKEAGFKLGAEIGVETGIYSRFMIDTIPGLKLICVDPWKAYLKNSQEREDKVYERAMGTLSGCNVEIMRMTSMEASKNVPNNSLDFVYIDGLHDFDNVMMDMIVWANKVKVGGIISGHDYIHQYQVGIIQAVNAYTSVHNVYSWYITTDKLPSWFWIKHDHTSVSYFSG